MDFSYKDFNKHSFYRPDSFGALGAVAPEEMSKLQNRYDEDGGGVIRALWSLHRRVTPDYFRMVYRAQTGALGYSKKVFPTYKYIMPDALADDWLSTVDWPKRYPTRDHSLHQTLTAYIVAKLLGNGEEAQSFKLPDNRNMLGYCCDRILNSPKMTYFWNYAKSVGVDCDMMSPELKKWWVKDVFYEASVISALFHDMGYPWQFVNRLSHHIEVAEYGETMKTVCSAALTKDAIKNRLLIFPFYGYSETNLRHAPAQLEKKVTELIEKGLRDSHGLPGALGFMCLNDKIRKYSQIPSLKEASYRLVLDWAAVGIMMHDMEGLYWDDKKKSNPKNPILRLSFDLDPLSSLISMADILEEFYRPAAQFKLNVTKTAQSVQLNYGFPCDKTEVYVKGKTLYIRYKYKESKDAALNRDRRIDEVNEYFNPSNGYVDLSSLGITGVDCDTEKG